MTDAYTLDKWKKVKTVGDYLDLLEDPNTNWQNLLDTFIDKSKSGFWLAGNIKNLPPTKLSTPAIHNDELNKETMTKPEMVMHEANNYGNGYDRHVADDWQYKVADVLGFESPSVWLNNQPPGALMARHVDVLTCFMYEKGSERDLLFDKIKRQPAGSKSIYRCFIALEDWQPGQLFSFEPDYWTNWKKGDIIFFEWQHTPHSTANTGFKDRPLLKITGTLKDENWIMKAKNTGEITHFVYD